MLCPKADGESKRQKGVFQGRISACRRHISLTCDMIAGLSQMILANGDCSGSNFPLIPNADWCLIWQASDRRYFQVACRTNRK